MKIRGSGLLLAGLTSCALTVGAHGAAFGAGLSRSEQAPALANALAGVDDEDASDGDQQHEDDVSQQSDDWQAPSGSDDEAERTAAGPESASRAVAEAEPEQDVKVHNDSSAMAESSPEAEAEAEPEQDVKVHNDSSAMAESSPEAEAEAEP
ncbi:hypothetical protein ACIHCX_24905, partial [Streptomyces sp. NPDC052043]